MTPADNVFYFNNNVDVRLCLKNGYSTLKQTWAYLAPKEFKVEIPPQLSGNFIHLPYVRRNWYTNALHRYSMCMKYQDLWNIPFRKDSYRIAVKRDPVERFISAVSYLDSIKIETSANSKKKYYIDLTNVTIDDIDHILDCLQNGTIRDEHFFSQTYFLGNVNDYDKIYYISEMPLLLKKLADDVDISSAERDRVINTWQNKTKNTDKRVQLTDEQKIRVIKLYAKDYANGWC